LEGFSMDSMSDTDHHAAKHHISAKEVRQHAGPWLIAVGVAIKSVLALATALGLELWGAQRMHDWIGMQIERQHLNPDHGFFAELMRLTSHGTVHPAAVLLVLYACVHGAEAWGLWRDKAWASWLGCVGAALYLPVSGLALWNAPNWITVAVVGINVGVVLVLSWNIRTLHARRIAASH
jgi:uncharacterized membrane protein (DUF2068 family)